MELREVSNEGVAERTELKLGEAGRMCWQTCLTRVAKRRNDEFGVCQQIGVERAEFLRLGARYSGGRCSVEGYAYRGHRGVVGGQDVLGFVGAGVGCHVVGAGSAE
ncbi:BQ5605_C009g05506 [Microbotryum silenes-dioicae]|uniref:BQ5605_C009g05506 protein n=1 Tax=Microbotryum silenes-dioicae TaxID=796604 RepID=A0A2X0N0A6_9BASI|nr:BQ5605_C009g05506 [Microbotryum silenes-dioicae]